ncbi:MAG: peptide-methionine (S)-S-oxide reductase MsrA [Rhodanobacter sp.]|nr:MAG: peptide-methionine (S)-S-oxide reductase MsrA [Rhodanobacter sp.]TAM13193.1 MAG: peptide-methionine (S)-S-oxide reductase MsrA [Rhodanobacter sp.]TAM35387.1 MAG: peptide-methionine (S)-S-oxide reductase MsrA [Rhodanobacter sp.]
MPRREDALPGHDEVRLPGDRHAVLGGSLLADDHPGAARAWFAMGCYWGAERKFWSVPGVLTTAVGFAGGYTRNPSYHEVCTGMTGHAETVLVVFDPARVAFDTLLTIFWEGHDPTQGMRQGNDVGTQYRSAIYAADAVQLAAAEASAQRYQAALAHAGFGAITTEVALAGPFYYAEDAHQQYLAKTPHGYCGLGSTGVSCPAGVLAAAP